MFFPPRWESSYRKVDAIGRIPRKETNTGTLVGLPVASESLSDPDRESAENTRPEAREMAEAIAVRLEVRRRFYRGGLVVFAVLVLTYVIVFGAITDPSMNSSSWLYALSGAFSAIVGTAVVLWWVYSMRKVQLYEQAGRTLLGEK